MSYPSPTPTTRQSAGGTFGSYEPGGATGNWSGNYGGSYDEWITQAAKQLTMNFTMGDPATAALGGKFQGIGSPGLGDYQSGMNGGTAQTSRQTFDYFIKVLENGGGSDPYLKQQFGTPPGTQADYGIDPNSSIGVQQFIIAQTVKAAEDERNWTTKENRLDREAIAANIATQVQGALAAAGLQAAATVTAAGIHAAATVSAASIHAAATVAAAQIAAQAGIDIAKIDAASREAVALIAANASKYGADAAREASKYAADRQYDASVYGADAHLTGIREQIAGSWAEAQLADVLARYVAEGDWGTQKWVVEQNNEGAMDRLLLELGDREADRVQRALEAKDRHHVEMMNLTLEVAKYDSELAAQPRNWLAYASWLGNRDQVVNGLTLAMAADLVPEEQANAAAANSGDPAGQTAAATGLHVQADEASAATGESGEGVSDPNDPTGQGAPAAATAGGEPGYGYNGMDLSDTDYSAQARALLGMDPNAASGAPTPEQLADAQKMYATDQRVPGFKAWAGPTTNALGMNVNPSGQAVDYRNFSDLLPSLQEMKIGEVESVRGKAGSADFFKEMEKSRPKGQSAGVAGRG